jgi:hypothetical protein
VPQHVSAPRWFGHVGHVVPHKLTSSPDSTAASGPFQMAAVMRPVDLARSASPATAAASQRSTRSVWVSVPESVRLTRGVSRAGSSRSAMRTDAPPRCPYALAGASPIPLAPPVTTGTVSRKSLDVTFPALVSGKFISCSTVPVALANCFDVKIEVCDAVGQAF